MATFASGFLSSAHVVAVAVLAEGAFGFPFAIALPWAESKYARTLSDWGPLLVPLKWQWGARHSPGCSRWGISETSKWQSVHVFFSCTDPLRLSAVAKRSRTWPATRSCELGLAVAQGALLQRDRRQGFGRGTRRIPARDMR